ncbi:MAG: hypothetical protein EOO53_21020 [Gammaproteobacteria bacterium]|nr:MAG: hypothetical protein EOO53_21020 [Gammaproteobacteria bacterium]
MRKWTEQVKATILNEWEHSDLTRADFCQKKGMSIASLSAWCKKSGLKKEYSKRQTLAAENEFLELSTDNFPTFSEKPRVLRIQTSYGSVIEVPL